MQARSVRKFENFASNLYNYSMKRLQAFKFRTNLSGSQSRDAVDSSSVVVLPTARVECGNQSLLKFFLFLGMHTSLQGCYPKWISLVYRARALNSS